MPTLNRNTNKRDTIQAWLNAIDQANHGIFPNQHSAPHLNHSSSPFIAAAAATDTTTGPSSSLAYLKLLEEKLRRIPSYYWNRPPRSVPPSFASFRAKTAAVSGNHGNGSGNGHHVHWNYSQNGMAGVQVPMLLVPSAVVSSKTLPTQATMLAANKNPYAALSDFSQDDDDDDDDEDDYNHPPDDDDDDEDEPEVDSNNPNANMNIRRLLLRILSSQSEIQARFARDAVSGASVIHQQSRRPLWTIGSQHISQAVFGLHQAVQVVDEEISFYLSQQQKDTNNNNAMSMRKAQQLLLQQQQLQQDAKVLQVALDHYTREEVNFQKKAEMQKIRLEQRLFPQWQSRDDIKKRLGERRWRNNPNPKMDHALKRQQDEEELKEIEEALEVLMEVQNRSNVVRDSVRDLMQEKWRTSSTSNKPGQEEESGEGGGGRGMYRYNGVRPTDATLIQRVSWEDYPDPTRFGWIFTGSNETSRVEFFELMQTAAPPSSSMEGILVKLDWYYTTATIKTSLDHPRQGKQQLFGSQVTPDVYVQILQNPRTHTNVRYHTTAGAGNDSGRGGGGGRGRGRGSEVGRGRGRGGYGRGGRGRGRGRRGGGRGV